MSKRIFINNLNTYVSQAIFSELRNDVGEDGEKNPDANTIFGTYIDKDSSIKPDGVKKMLKVSNWNYNCNAYYSVRNPASPWNTWASAISWSSIYTRATLMTLT